MWRRLYAAVVRAASHPRAPWGLATLAFAEASFFPIPPDVMLAPMVLAARQRAVRYALIATCGSVAGAVLGYLIGYFFMQALLPWLQSAGLYADFDTARQWFEEYGFWAMLLAGFSPLPYKVFTLAAGAVTMAFPPFLLASAVGRGARFLLVALLVSWLGPVFEQHLLKYLDWIGWIIVAIVVVVVGAWQLA